MYKHKRQIGDFVVWTRAQYFGETLACVEIGNGHICGVEQSGSQGDESDYVYQINNRTGIHPEVCGDTVFDDLDAAFIQARKELSEDGEEEGS